MQLFTRIFDALANRPYEPDLFGKALPCLSAIGCALAPDYACADESASATDNVVGGGGESEGANGGGLVMNDAFNHNNNETSQYGDSGGGGGGGGGGMEGGASSSSRMMTKTTTPRSPSFDTLPLDTSGVALPLELDELVRAYAENEHDAWCAKRMAMGWSYGSLYSDSQRRHPLLRPFGMLTRDEQIKYEELTRETLKCVKVVGWMIERGSTTSAAASAAAAVIPRMKELISVTSASGSSMGGVNASSSSSPLAQQQQKGANAYQPRPFDLSNVTITREQEELGSRLAVNCHALWSRQKQANLESVGASLHDRLVPYDLLTDEEKIDDLHFSIGLVKFLLFNGYQLHNNSNNNNGAG